MQLERNVTRVVDSKDGTPIAFERSGEGPSIILVGGALQYRSIDTRTAELARRLAAHFTVFHYDRRGRGESGSSETYAVQREVEDIEALIIEAGGSAFAFGMSSGAVLALEAAARGLAITKLALYEPPFIVDDGRSPLPEDYETQLGELISSGRRGDAVELFMTKAVGMPVEAVAGMRSTQIWPAFEAVAPTLAYDAAVMGETMSGHPLPTTRWSTVAIPTLVMDGGESPMWQRRAVQALVDVLSNARRSTLEGQTHDIAPETLTPVLEAFFGG